MAAIRPDGSLSRAVLVESRNTLSQRFLVERNGRFVGVVTQRAGCIAAAFCQQRAGEVPTQWVRRMDVEIEMKNERAKMSFDGIMSQIAQGTQRTHAGRRWSQAPSYAVEASC